MKKAKIKQRCDEANRWMKNSRRVILARWLKPGNARTALNCSVVAGKKAGVEIHSDKEAVIIFSHSDMKTGRYCTASMSNTCFYRHAQQWGICHWHLIGSLSVHVNERESHQRGLQRQLQLCDTAFRQARRQRIRKPKAGSSVPAGVPVKLYIDAPYAYARLISNVPARASCSTQVVCRRSSACARGASARERKNSLHLRCEHSLAAVATNCQEWRKRMGRGREECERNDFVWNHNQSLWM